MKIKNIIILLTLIVLLVVTIFGYFHMKNEQENIKIDEYNFTQLEKFESALINIQDEDNKVMSLEDFNETFNEDIDPVQNCYYISTTDIYWWEEDIEKEYIFSTLLHSNKYKKIYGKDYFIYPESVSNKIEESLCGPWGWVCSSDMIFEWMIDVISNPCE